MVGSQGTRSSLLGSISAEISRRAPCPVIVVPAGADHHLPAGTDMSLSTAGSPASPTGARTLDGLRPVDALGDRSGVLGVTNGANRLSEGNSLRPARSTTC